LAFRNDLMVMVSAGPALLVAILGDPRLTDEWLLAREFAAHVQDRWPTPLLRGEA
jgi:hypothetical protein